jgi:hypothetical protein
VFNNPGHKGNANLNTEIPSHPRKNVNHQEKQTTNAGKDVRKGTLIHCWDKCKLVQPLWKSIWISSENSIMELPYDLAIPLGTYVQRNQSQHAVGTPTHPYSL